jgi:integrase
MASLEERSGRFRLIFRYGGRKFHHALGTRDRREAEGCLARLEESLRFLERGRLVPPPGADLPVFLLSDGKIMSKPEVAPVLTLADLSERYGATQLGALEKSTLATIGTHLKHLTVTLGAKFPVQSLTLVDLQQHVERRGRAKGLRGRTVSPTTIKKEIASLSAAWGWATRMGLLTGPFPSKGLVYQKAVEKPPFRTSAEIERQIERGGLSAEERRELWDSLFLTLSEINEVLEHVRVGARHSFIHPMFAFAAHTGARRSEILRSRIADFDFDAGTVLVREQKRVRGKRTTRRVPLSPFLARVMRGWFTAHPGGPYSICQEPTSRRRSQGRSEGQPLTRDEANDHFQRTLAGGKWAVIRGWHVFRHSFASNCAARGVDQRLIDAWLGHTTDEMRRRYRHLLPDQQAEAIRSVFAEG